MCASPNTPLSLYVHIPWCVRKCPYCDFNSHAVREPVDQVAYVNAVLTDLEHETRGVSLPPVDSVFIGGGTPSLLETSVLRGLLNGIAHCCVLQSDAEITLEANPGTAEAKRFASFRQAGINRLSLGVQSLDDDKLRRLDRIHSALEARQAFVIAREAGFDNVNLDLMYGLPTQTLDQAMSDLSEVIELGPEHLSWYQLTLEPNTGFHHDPPTLPDEDILGDMMERGETMLEAAGYRRYEIAAYARPGRECRHNLNYWQFGDYLGVGAGAHGKRTLADGTIRRRSKLRQPAAYVAAASHGAVSEQRILETPELPVEFFMNALRLVDGVPSELFTQRTGLSQKPVAEALALARTRGLLSPETARLRPTALGLRFLNELLAMFEPGVQEA